MLDTLCKIHERMQTVAKHTDVYYEDDTKELLIVPLLKEVFNIQNDFNIFRDYPDARCEKRRWDLQIVEAPNARPSDSYAVFECKRAREVLSFKKINSTVLQAQLDQKEVDGKGNHYAQVYLCGLNKKFCRPSVVCLTNGLKWVRFSEDFFKLPPDGYKQTQFSEVEFEDDDIEDYIKWGNKFQQLKQLLSSRTTERSLA